ncbi:hypothetical protein HOLleu_30280 [Holothuria leucospilota]|uniref:Uncharacterized protein n=1 Tax=Holothuria leucospilota TaxID=206669 RepID=A0A9Q1BKG6_HOLLE|nr:hypothetical protein HOLleu_30280 [Holothuria leucospilota]
MEGTCNTPRSSDRTRKMNKPVVNSDLQAAELAQLRQQVQAFLVHFAGSKIAHG